MVTLLRIQLLLEQMYIEDKVMNGTEYLDKHVSKQTLIEVLYQYNCPRDFGFETVLSSNKEYCCEDYQGNCEKCWNSNVINNIN